MQIFSLRETWLSRNAGLQGYDSKGKTGIAMDVVICCVHMCRPGLAGRESVMRWDGPQIWGRDSDWEGWEVTGLPVL